MAPDTVLIVEGPYRLEGRRPALPGAAGTGAVGLPGPGLGDDHHLDYDDQHAEFLPRLNGYDDRPAWAGVVEL